MKTSTIVFFVIILCILLAVIPDKWFLLPLGLMYGMVMFGNNKR